MVKKNTKGGKKHKQLKSQSNKADIGNILLKDNSGFQYYAVVEKNYGHNADVKFIKEEHGNDNSYENEFNNDYNTSGKTLVSSKAIVRGSIFKKCRLNNGDVVLISLRDYDPKKVDILYKYSNDEIKLLIKHNILEDEFIKLVNNFTTIINKDKNYTMDDIMNDGGDDVEFNDNTDNEEDDIYDEDDIDNM